jgi:arginine-tRNA-protein transferase
MAFPIQSYTEAPHACAYLPNAQASLEVRVLVDVSADELGEMLARGWRRFGPTYFRPACRACDACIPTRIVVSGFRGSQSQRRAARQAAHLTRSAQVPRVDAARLDLYARWHRQREGQRGWHASPLDAEQYADQFAFPHPAVREVTFRDPAQGNRLVGVGIIDEVPGALSAVYFFWDPEHAPSSLGTAHIVGLVSDAAARGLDYVYLGYKVEACPSLAYKGRFQPQQSLRGRPGEAAGAEWVDACLEPGT